MTVKKGHIGWLTAFAAFDVSVIALIAARSLDLSELDVASASRLLTMLLAPPALYMLSSAIPVEIKTSMAFWRVKHALPGHRAFSTYVFRDTRIDVKQLKQRIGPFPKNPARQQAEWYRIYRIHRAEGAVLDANARYVLYRDLAAVSALLVGIVPLVLWMLGENTLIRPASAVFAVQYVVACICAQAAGISFVKNVLAIESVVPGK